MKVYDIYLVTSLWWMVLMVVKSGWIIGFGKYQKNIDQISYFPPNHQSWEIGVVCPALA